ncbi:MAG: 4Fe-4S binding protein [Candidatus Krumholzibacteria bacterium]|nr:4Fe-4S binding protein [Candidatus Krumholzibacteria bacterium]
MKRRIIKIDESLCTGCSLCIPSCREGALRIIDGKARVVSDILCDGLGACIGHCPEGAITTETREAEPMDRPAPAFTGCPGSRIVNIETDASRAPAAPPSSTPTDGPSGGAAVRPSRLSQWPVQIMLVPPDAPFLDGADLLVAADCVPFAYAGFHEDLLAGKALLVGCPKLDDAEHYLEKLTAMFRLSDVRSVTVAHMEVPCCTALVRLVERAILDSGKDVPFESRMIGIRGNEI